MLQLVKLSVNLQKQFDIFMREWSLSGEKIYPKSIRITEQNNFTMILKHLEKQRLLNEETYFALNVNRNIFIGAVNLRYNIDELMSQYVGNIGYGIIPSERRKGYCKKILKLAIDKCKQNELHKILLACDKDNVASAKSIIYNGGIFENEVVYKGIVIQRFWIYC